MSKVFALIVRNGSIVDATGSDSYISDNSIGTGRIAAIGKAERRALEKLAFLGGLLRPDSSISTRTITIRSIILDEVPSTRSTAFGS